MIIMSKNDPSLQLEHRFQYPKTALQDLALCLLSQPPNGAPHGHRTSSVQCVSTSSFDFPAVLAAPNSNGLPLHCILQKEKYYSPRLCLADERSHVERRQI